MNEISPQQRREHRDPGEGNSPVPMGITALAVLLGGFGVAYILMSKPESPANWGDGRTLTELQPPASSGTAAVTNKVDGAALFAARCAACHQATGAGLPGVFPPLAGSEWVNGKAETVAAIVLHGIEGELTVLSQKFNGVMPPFKDQLNDAEIAALATYIRSAWGNSSSGVEETLVAKIRQDTGTRGAFQGDGELSQLK